MRLDPQTGFYEKPHPNQRAKDIHMTEVSTRPHVGATKAPPAKAAAPIAAHPNDAAAPSVSPTLIVLTLRPVGAKFNGDRVGRAQEAGFKRLKEALPNPMGYACPDTGQEIARFVVDREAEMQGRLKEMQLHVDPEGCAVWHKAGSMLMEMLEKYCILINASLCDGMGKCLSDEDRTALAEHIDVAIQRRINLGWDARLIEAPNGELRATTELSFVYTTRRKAGSKKKVFEPTHFGVPALHYHEGRAEGMRAAIELVQFYQKHAIERPGLSLILRDALAGASGYGYYEKASTDNATAGFLEIIEELVRFASIHVRSLSWVEQRIQAAEQSHVRWAEQREKEKRELIERLRKGREAAKARRAKGEQ